MFLVVVYRAREHHRRTVARLQPQNGWQRYLRARCHNGRGAGECERNGCVRSPVLKLDPQLRKLGPGASWFTFMKLGGGGLQISGFILGFSGLTARSGT